MQAGFLAIYLVIFNFKMIVTSIMVRTAIVFSVFYNLEDFLYFYQIMP